MKRIEVEVFSELMESQLYANDHKSGWKNDTAASLLRRLREETDELAAEICSGNVYKIGNEAADVANFAMMIADVCGALKDEVSPTNSMCSEDYAVVASAFGALVAGYVADHDAVEINETQNQDARCSCGLCTDAHLLLPGCTQPRKSRENIIEEIVHFVGEERGLRELAAAIKTKFVRK